MQNLDNPYDLKSYKTAPLADKNTMQNDIAIFLQNRTLLALAGTPGALSAIKRVSSK